MVRRLYQDSSLGIRGERRRHPMELYTIGIDLGKTVFHLVGLNQRGEVVVRKKFSREQLLHFTANLQVGLIGMEACGGSHFLGRSLRGQGHEVRFGPPTASGCQSVFASRLIPINATTKWTCSSTGWTDKCF